MWRAPCWCAGARHDQWSAKPTPRRRHTTSRRVKLPDDTMSPKHEQDRVHFNTPCHLTRTRVLGQPRGDTRPQPALAALVPRSRAAAQPPHARAPRRYERRTRARPRGRRTRRRRRADERQLQGAPSLPSLPPFSPTLLSPCFTLVSHPCLPPLPPTRASRPSCPLSLATHHPRPAIHHSPLAMCAGVG